MRNCRRSLLFLIHNLFLLLHTTKCLSGSSSSRTPSSSTTTTGSKNSNGAPLYIGFDLGTSGARISVIKKQVGDDESSSSSLKFQEVYTKAVPWGQTYGDYDAPDAWMKAVTALLEGAGTALSSLESVVSICVSGTSASCLMVDGANAAKVTRSPRMYDYDVVQSAATTGGDDDTIYGVKALEHLDRHAPARHTARSPTGSLAKLLAWNEERTVTGKERLCHQADYVALQFLSNEKACGSGRNQRFVSSDWHNCLKLGYDVRKLEWPDWIQNCLREAGVPSPESILPANVVSPGEPIGTVSVDAQERFRLPPNCVVVGGTTDSNAAFFAATGTDPALGCAVTSLGSTLAMKQLSATYVEDASVGVYSHRFPSGLTKDGKEAWLVGGASNVGCAVLRQQNFSNDELDQLSQQIDPTVESPLSYYPLTKKGERFPVADSSKAPIMEPVPQSRREYLHAILQGISEVEKDGFVAMGELGASPTRPCQVWTCGGGSRNGVWSEMRQRRLRTAFGTDNVRVSTAENVEASFGAALLASLAG